ncbi:MAG: serine hydroxymethyltransferase [Dehalococcoidia bacterium]|nr:MAG: serine hydroxymethyltransferase [Dehalococcoidia bacterium]
MKELPKKDGEIASLIWREEERQSRKLVLIAAENYASQAVLEAQGSVLTNKYAEGYPGHRYYGGCQEIDKVEKLAIQRAKQLYGAEHANVQSHSGTQANVAAYLAFLNHGDTVMGMNLAHGGHLSHGSAVSFSGQWYRFIHYGVNKETERLDYEEIERLAKEHRPKLIVAGASAYPRIIDFERFHYMAEEVGAQLMVDMAHLAGLVAAGLHPSPVPWAEVITSTTHKTLRGPRGGFILSKQEFARRLDAAVFPGMQGGPLMHVIAAKAVAFYEAMQPDFISYQQKVVENAKVLASELEKLGFRLVAGGTDNHLVLIDLRGTGITGKLAEEVLDSVGISTNRNSIPFDLLPPQITSGLRLGTPAVTTRGLGPQEMRQIALLIHKVLANLEDEKVKHQVSQEVKEISQRFPLFSGC